MELEKGLQGALEQQIMVIELVIEVRGQRVNLALVNSQKNELCLVVAMVK